MRTFTDHLRASAPTLAMLAMALAVVCLAGTGRLPAPADARHTGLEKDVLLSYLPDVNGITYARNVIYLFADDDPLMVVWVEDDPAELYGADGHFVAPLDFQELSRVIRRASALMQDDPRWPTSPHAERRGPGNTA